MLARNHFFTLLSMENDSSPVALVAGFTNSSLQITYVNLSYNVSLMISKTLNRFQNIGKAINLRILDQHFQNFELGKKISSSYSVSIIFFHVVHLLGYVLRAQNAYQKRLHIGICFETRLIKTFFNGRHY